MCEIRPTERNEILEIVRDDLIRNIEEIARSIDETETLPMASETHLEASTVRKFYVDAVPCVLAAMICVMRNRSAPSATSALMALMPLIQRLMLSRTRFLVEQTLILSVLIQPIKRRAVAVKKRGPLSVHHNESSQVIELSAWTNARKRSRRTPDMEAAVEQYRVRGILRQPPSKLAEYGAWADLKAGLTQAMRALGVLRAQVDNRIRQVDFRELFYTLCVYSIFGGFHTSLLEFC